MNLDVCLQNMEKVRKKFAVANRPSGVVSRIHVYIHLLSKCREIISFVDFLSLVFYIVTVENP